MATKENKAPDLNTVEGQKENARQVDQGESAYELLQQAAPFVTEGSYKDYSGNPAEYARSLRERIDAFLMLHNK